MEIVFSIFFKKYVEEILFYKKLMPLVEPGAFPNLSSEGKPADKAKWLLSFVLIALVLSTSLCQVNAEQYHLPTSRKESVYDISLNWTEFIGSRDYVRYELWDDGFWSHCYISFKFNAGVSLSIPANLRLNYPEIVEPGSLLDVETELNIAGQKEFAFTSEFFVKIDLDLPGVGMYVPGLGFVDDIKNEYGGAWEFKFDLNSENIESVLNKVWLADDTVGDWFLNRLEISNFVTIQDIDVNSQTLGQLAFGSIKINLLKAILMAAKTLTSISPPISAIISGLDWLLTNVIKVESGVIIKPSLNAAIISTVSSNDKVTLNTNSITYNEDISSRRIQTQVSESVLEEPNNNFVNINYGPLEYRLSVVNSWEYYLSLDLDFLNLDLYANTWSWNLGTFPNLSTEALARTNTISCNIKLDQPLSADEPTVNNGDISLWLSDASGLSDVTLVYSTDRASWERTNMISHGESYTAKPIMSVREETTVYYYFIATDGDNDVYQIDNNGAYYSYSLSPEPVGLFQTIFGFSSDSQQISIIIVAAIITGILIAIVYLVYRKNMKRPLNKGYVIPPPPPPV